jgi:hypothetical protein
MKPNVLETFEEKFYFKTSHLIWHVFIGIAGIGLIVGILIFLWGLSPSLKPGVEKPDYPEPVQISAAEIRQIIQPPPPPVEPSKVQPITAAAGPALATKKQAKSEFRSLAWKIMGGSLLVIALVALFLVLFSIQRNIRLLRENMVVAK